MKDILKSFKENATSRLNNPIIGAYVLAWTVMNINGVSLFLLVDSSKKIEMIQNKTWGFCDDIFIPFIVSAGYLIFLPLLNMAYEFLNDGVFNFHRSKNKNITAKKLALQKKETVIAEIEADVNYLHKLKDKDIDHWIKEKNTFKNEFLTLKQRYSTLVSNTSEDSNKSLAEITAVSRELHVSKSKVSELEKDMKKQQNFIKQDTDQLSSLLKSIENRGGDSNLTNSDIKSIRELNDAIRINSLIWDEIPF